LASLHSLSHMSIDISLIFSLHILHIWMALITNLTFLLFKIESTLLFGRDMHIAQVPMATLGCVANTYTPSTTTPSYTHPPAKKCYH
jgi:hypothetical protein